MKAKLEFNIKLSDAIGVVGPVIGVVGLVLAVVALYR